MKEDAIEYEKIEIESAKQGWILKRKGKPAEIYVRWESLRIRLEELLTTRSLPW